MPWMSLLDFKDGEQILVARRQWRMRPGQLVRVLLGETSPEPGLYLPMNSIKPVNDKTGEIFVAVDGKAKKVKVKILSNIGELFRIEVLDPGDTDLVTTGSQIITDHIHFLQHDESIRVVKIAELKP